MHVDIVATIIYVLLLLYLVITIVEVVSEMNDEYKVAEMADKVCKVITYLLCISFIALCIVMVY